MRSVEAEAAGRAHDGPDGAERGEDGHATEHRRERDGHGRPDHVVKEAPHSLPHEQVGVEFGYGEDPGYQEEANSESKYVKPFIIMLHRDILIFQPAT